MNISIDKQYWLYLLILCGCCLKVSANDLPQAGNNADVCAEQTTYQLQANTPSAGGVGAWAVISKPVNVPNPIFSDINNPQALLSNLLFGTGNEDSVVYELEWSIQYVGAVLLKDTLHITRWKTPSDANAGIDQALVCERNDAQLGGNLSEVGQGQWRLVSGEGTIADASNANTTVTNLGYGENIFAWEISNGPACSPSVSNVTLTRYAQPQANAGVDTLKVCLEDGIIALTGNDPSLQEGLMTGKWSFLQGPETLVISNPTQFNTTVRFSKAGNYQLRWEVSSGTCGTDSDRMILQVFTPPNAQAGSDIALCETAGFGVLAGNNPIAIDAFAQGRWQQLSGSGTLSFTDSTAYNTTFTWKGTGIYQLQWIVSNGPCSVATDVTEIVIYNQPQAEAGQAIVSCLPTGPALLGANNPDILQNTAQGVWTQASGPGTMVFANANDPSSSITWDRIGVYKLYWTVTNGLCGSALDSVLASVGQAPVIDAGPDLAFCFESTSSNAQLSGNDPSTFNANGQWVQKSGPGTIIFNDPTRYNTSVRWNQAGIYELEWRIFNACNNVADVMRLEIYEQPSVATANGNFQACETPVRMRATSPAVGQGAWTALDGGVLESPNDPKTIVTGLVQGNQRFRWTVSNGVCPNTSETITLNYQPKPDFNINIKNNPCFGDTLGEIAVVTTGGGSNFQYSLNGGALQSSPTFSPLVTAAYQLRILSDNGCSYDISNISIESPLPLKALGIEGFERPTGASIADGRLTLLEANGGVQPYQYSLDSGISFSNNLIFSNLLAGNYDLLVKDANGCLATAKIALPNRAAVEPFNAFSPNNDGINDLWNMPFLKDYPNAVVQVFNTWGEELYRSEGSYEPWDGVFKGNKVVAGTYYYLIDLKNGEPPYKGSVVVMY